MGSWIGGAYDAVAGAGDYAAGSVDESIGRQFDDKKGGGVVDADTWIDNEGDPFGAVSSTFSFGGDVMGIPEEKQSKEGIISQDPSTYNSWIYSGVSRTGQQFDNTPGGGWPDKFVPGDPDIPGLGGNTFGKLTMLVLVMAGLYLLRPVLEIGANVSEEG